MDDSVEALRERIEYLEHVATVSENDSKKSLDAQVDELADTVSEFFQNHSDVSAVHEKLHAAGLWKDIEQLWGPLAKSEQKDQMSNEDKTALVRARLGTLESVYASFESIQSIEMPATFKSKDLAVLRETLPQVQHRINEIIQQVEELSIRTAQVSKAWISSLNEQNQTWLDFEYRMQRCERALRRIEGKEKQQQEYETRYKASESS